MIQITTLTTLLSVKVGRQWTVEEVANDDEIAMPIDFEADRLYIFENFGNAATDVVDNPDIKWRKRLIESWSSQ